MTVYTVILFWQIVGVAVGQTSYCIPGSDTDVEKAMNAALDAGESHGEKFLPSTAKLYKVEVVDDRCVWMPRDLPAVVSRRIK